VIRKLRGGMMPPQGMPRPDKAKLKKQQTYRAKLDRGDDTMLTTGTTPFLRAAKAGDIDAMKLLLAKSADAKLTTRNGINPLMAAAGLGAKEEDATGRHKTEAEAVEAIRLCLENGVDISWWASSGYIGSSIIPKIHLGHLPNLEARISLDTIIPTG
jgi:hypothetical protein